MERETDTVNSFVNFLLAHGYPQESIVFEYPLGSYRTDLAIIDVKTKVPVAIFEFKRVRSEQSFKMGVEQLKTFTSKMDNPNIPTYLVFGKQGDPPFEYVRIKINKTDRDLQPADSIFSYETLQASGKQTAIAVTKKKQKKAFDGFKIICWLVATVVLSILILMKFKVLSFSVEELSLIGVVIALVVFPFASELKILGIEFKRLSNE